MRAKRVYTTYGNKTRKVGESWMPVVLVCAVALAAVVGGLWLIGRVARWLGGK